MKEYTFADMHAYASPEFTELHINLSCAACAGLSGEQYGVSESYEVSGYDF